MPSISTKSARCARSRRSSSAASRRHIEQAVGPASQETALPDGRTLLQWRATGYHIAIVFEPNGRCIGVTHENGRRVRGAAAPPAA